MEYNIFQNDFYESRPGLPWAYRLTALYGLSEKTAVITKSIKEAHLPDLELKTIQVFFGGADKYVPTRYQNYGTFSLTFNEDCNLSAYKTLLWLFRRSLDNREDTDNKRYKYSNLQIELKLVLEILDPKNINLQDTKVKTKKDSDYDEVISGREYNDMRVVAKYEFGNCFIDKIDDIDLDYSSEEIIEWTVTVGYNSIAITYPGKKKLTLGISEDTFTETEFEAYDSYDIYHKTDDLDRVAKSAVKSMQESEKKREAAFNPDEAYSKAQEELQKIKDAAKNDREAAMAKANEDANDQGYTSTGDFVTGRQKENVIMDELEYSFYVDLEDLKEKHKFNEWQELGVNLMSMNESQIKEQLISVYTNRVNDPKSTGYGHYSWDDEVKLVQAGLKAKKNFEADREDLIREMEKLEDDIRIAFEDSDSVEFNMTESTNKYYDGERSTQEGKTKVFTQRAGKIQQLQRLIQTYEEECEKNKEEELKWFNARKKETEKTVPNKKILKEQFNYMVYYQDKRMEAEAKLKKAKEEYDKLQAENKSY